MLNTTNTRRKNLGAIVERDGLSNVARLVGKSASQLRDMIDGRKSFGEKVARDIEVALEPYRAPGWLSEEQMGEGDSSGAPSSLPIPLGLVPVLTWAEAGQWETVLLERRGSGCERECLLCPHPHSSSTFALRVRGVSMAPDFKDGEYIYVDPEVESEHGDHIVVFRPGAPEAEFRALIAEGGQRFLAPLNPDWPGPRLEPIGEETKICGVVVAKLTKLR